MTGDNYLRAAYSYLYIGDYDKASDSFSRAMAENPQNPAYYFYASVTALRSGDANHAKQWAERALDLAPSDAFYQEHLWMVLQELTETQPDAYQTDVSQTDVSQTEPIQ